MQIPIIFNFNKDTDIAMWQVVDDVVMGGRSSGKFLLDAEANGVFKGEVSLENNGGFSSVRYSLNKQLTGNYKKFSIRLKGDGKQYQFRVKSKAGQYYSYAASFQTTGNWQTVIIPFNTMYPLWRGQKLNLPNFSGETLEEIGFLIANKKAESFTLVIDKIELNQ